jgi:CRISPR-associated protein Csh2
MSDKPTLTSRREFVFLYDIKMGNPNGDPDENRPRVLPDKTHYVTDVRLKRFVRDYLKTQGQEILVDTIEGKTTNLTGRVAEFLARSGIQKVEKADRIVEILLASFTDARLFGSTFAFKTAKAKGEAEQEEALQGEADEGKKGTKKAKSKEKTKAVTATVIVGGQERKLEWPQPKTLTGAVQIAHGEVKHRALEVDINGTSVFGSAEEKTRGTFTSYYALRYALIGFNGVANQHSAKLSQMTDDDYDTLLKAMWYGIRSAGNTRTKRGQVPRLLLSIVYKAQEEFQFGNLCDYVKLTPRNGKAEVEWSSPEDYRIDLTVLQERLKAQSPRIDRIEFCVSPDVILVPSPAEFGLEGVTMRDLALDEPTAG